uniref:DNA repair protein XRCC3 n=1 Tax=Cacopsylla melanoneura TaxID=428564 RepID=A0A8D8PV70_9HEMI
MSSMSHQDKMKILGFEEWELTNIMELQKKPSFQVVETLFEMKETVISFGAAKFDNILKGGLRTGGITEIVGESGCGKTQLCLQLCLSLQISQPNQGVLYICTESVFPTARLAQLCNLSPLASSKCSDNIFITHCYEFADLKHTLETQTGFIQKKVGMLIIDSIAGIFRNTYPDDKYVQRAHDMRYLAHYLHDISIKHNLAVICSNQVTSAMTHSDKSVPALGLSWANLVTNRLVLSKSPFNQRTLTVEFSPYMPTGVGIQFDILPGGIG